MASSEDIPLFLDPETGRELCIRLAASELRARLCACGFSELATGLHSLRVGGATAASNASSGGDLVCQWMGVWLGTSRRRYQYATRGRIEECALEMARAPGAVLYRLLPASRCL